MYLFSLCYTARNELDLHSDTLEQIDISRQLIAKHSDVRALFV
jgi:hypothetical protein